ncbi:pleckstrin homology domain-containing family H member 3 isoform X2 [Carettochelys insculpta]|uniref:pleckstrin homology domain-containing family H member 3 isoform X2 n=1 Tax=Carettochelys insculpta TaxID=44489 RepID=UPI003EBD2103
MPFPGGLWWLLCCRQGFTLLRRDYGEAEREPDGEDESFELRSKGAPAALQLSLSQPVRTSSSSERSLPASEETHNLITEQGPGPVDEDADVLVKGWLQREVRGGVKGPWIRPRKYWFVLTQDSLDYYGSSEKGARRLGTLVLTSLCSVLWPDKQRYKETGYWSVTVFGRKHCYRLYTEHLNEAMHWACATQKVIHSKAPVQTPTQLLMRDIEENCGNPEMLEQIYRCNPVLRYTSSPLYAPLLPFPYGSRDRRAPGPRGYGTLRDEAVKLFNSLQQLETARDPEPLIQGILQTCLELQPLVDEIYCQLVKQTTEPPVPGAPGDLRYWQLLTCMSCTFLPSPPVLRYLRFHLGRTEGAFPGSEMAAYGRFIGAALGKTTVRECVPSLAEIAVLSRRQDMLCTVHCPGASACTVTVSSHTTAEEVARELVARLGLWQSPNVFALFEQSRHHERPVGRATLVADVLTSLAGEGATQDSVWRLCFKHYGFLDTENVPRDSLEFALLFERAHEMVIRGYVPASEDTLQSLAALRLQSLNSDFSTQAPVPRPEELFPAQALRSRLRAPCPGLPRGPPARLRAGLLAGALPWGQAQAKQQAQREQKLRGRLREESASVTAAILERWKLLQGMGRAEAMGAYLALVREWPGFGSTLFDVDFRASPEGSCPQRLWLGVGAKAVSLYKPGEAEPLDSFCYGHISSFRVSDSSTFHLSVGDRDLLFECSRVDEIAQLLHTYLTSLGIGQTPPGAELPDGCCLGNSLDVGFLPPPQRLCPATEPWRRQPSSGSFSI